MNSYNNEYICTIYSSNYICLLNLPVVLKSLAQHVLLTVSLTHTIIQYVVFGSRYTNIVLLFVVNSYKRGYIELINHFIIHVNPCL